MPPPKPPVYLLYHELHADQERNTDPVDSAKSIYQRNSLMYSKGQKVEPVKIEFFKKNMYRGLGVSMGRSCAVNAVFFSSFEFLKKRIKSMDDPETQQETTKRLQ